VSAEAERIRRLAELTVSFGANVQPGQIVSVSSEPGKEALTRAIAQVAYEQGAKFVDVRWFDPHVKRVRALYADPDTLGYVPPWYGQRMLALGDQRAAMISLSGPVEPHLMDDVDPERLGKDMLPRIRESIEVLAAQSTNWTVVPCPTVDWARLVHPALAPDAALEQLWDDIARACRLDEAEPVAAWNVRLDHLLGMATKLDSLRLDALRFVGPGTDLTVGLLPGSRWSGARMTTVGGIVHAPNLPTEEVFTSPDPARTEGVVRSTKPLFVSGALVRGLQVRFEGGRAVQFDAEQGAGTLEALAARDDGACRLGEVALVDRESRIGQLDTVFYDTLLDENAASHIALGEGFEFAVDGEDSLARLNHSEIHIDFMIGSDEVAVTGIAHDGTEFPLLRDGAWQI
jgi:aminopeptidase